MSSETLKIIDKSKAFTLRWHKDKNNRKYHTIYANNHNRFVNMDVNDAWFRIYQYMDTVAVRFGYQQWKIKDRETAKSVFLMLNLMAV